MHERWFVPTLKHYSIRKCFNRSTISWRSAVPLCSVFQSSPSHALQQGRLFIHFVKHIIMTVIVPRAQRHRLPLPSGSFEYAIWFKRSDLSLHSIIRHSISTSTSLDSELHIEQLLRLSSGLLPHLVQCSTGETKYKYDINAHMCWFIRRSLILHSIRVPTAGHGIGSMKARYALKSNVYCGLLLRRKQSDGKVFF